MKALTLIQHSDPHQVAATLKTFGNNQVIVMQIEKEVTGIWTDYHPDFEHIRVGFPSDSTDPYFDYLNPRKNNQTGLSIALSRTAFNRTVNRLYLCESQLLPAAKHALKSLDVEIGWGDQFKVNNIFLTRGFIDKQLKKFPLQQKVETNQP